MEGVLAIKRNYYTIFRYTFFQSKSMSTLLDIWVTYVKRSTTYLI